MIQKVHVFTTNEFEKVIFFVNIKLSPQIEIVTIIFIEITFQLYVLTLSIKISHSPCPEGYMTLRI